MMSVKLPSIEAALRREVDDHRQHYFSPALRVSLRVIEAMLPMLKTEHGVAINAPGGGLFISGEVSLFGVKVGYDNLHGMAILHLSANRIEDFSFPDRLPNESVTSRYFEDSEAGIHEMAQMAAACLNDGVIP